MNKVSDTTTCDPTGVSYKPNPQPISNLASAFSSNGHSINVHVLPDDNNVILAQTCSDQPVASPPFYCPFPGQAGVLGWRPGFSFLKSQPLNYLDETSCDARTPANPTGAPAGSGPPCIRRFPTGQNNSYHEVMFGVALGLPNWGFQDGSLIDNIAVSGNTLTLTTLNPHGLVSDPTNTGIPNGRITIAGAISNPNLNNTYLVQSVTTTVPFTFTIQVASGTTAPTKLTDPFLPVPSAVVASDSRFAT